MKSKNIHRTENEKQKLRDLYKGKTYEDIFGVERANEERKKRGRKYNRGEKYSKKSIFLMSIAKLGKTHKEIFGDKSEEVNEKRSASMKEKWKDPIYAEKVCINSIKGLYNRPTTYEQKISDLCFKYNLPFIYKGNGDFLINYKNPDFVNEQDKIVIEVFYSWYKIRDYGSVENYKEFCKKRYEPNGWKVIFIDEIDLFNKNWEDICLNKINEVILYVRRI